MIDYTKPFPCGECGKMVVPSEKHTYEDCLNFKEKIHNMKDKRGKENA